MAKTSAGILLFQRSPDLHVLLVHPGGPFWARRDLGAWSIPKGEYDGDEAAETTARRELFEEAGLMVEDDLIALGDVRQAGSKSVTAFALDRDFDVTRLVSNRFDIEWPPKSGRRQSFPEVDRAEWFDAATARVKMIPAQAVFIDRLIDHLAAG